MVSQVDTPQLKKVSLPWIVWGTVATFYFYQFLLRVSPSVIANELMRDLSIQACALGELASYYYVGYTAMQIPVGLLIDRIGVRRPAMFALFSCVFGCYVFATSSSFAMLSIGRLFMGVGSAFAFLSCVKAASLWFRPAQLGLIVGLTLMLGTAGGASAPPGISCMLNFMPWRHVFVFFLGVGIFLTVFMWSFVKDRRVEGDSASENLSVLKALKTIVSRSQTYVFGLYGGLMYIPLSAFADMWGTPYLMEAYSLPRSEATLIVAMMYVGIGLGAPGAAWLAERLESHKKVMILGALASAVFMGFCLYMQLALPIMYVLYFAFGLSLGVQFLAFSSVCQINPLHMAGTASAIQNMFSMLSGIIFQPLLGRMLEMVWDGVMVGGAPRYSADNFVYALTLIPVCLAVALILSFLMKETYVKDDMTSS